MFLESLFSFRRFATKRSRFKEFLLYPSSSLRSTIPTISTFQLLRLNIESLLLDIKFRSLIDDLLDWSRMSDLRLTLERQGLKLLVGFMVIRIMLCRFGSSGLPLWNRSSFIRAFEDWPRSIWEG